MSVVTVLRKPSDSYLLVNGNILTLHEATACAAAVRVCHGQITELFLSPPKPKPHEPCIDLAGATVLPGLVDAHVHLAGLGQLARTADLTGLTSLEAVAACLRRASASLREGEWLIGRGWDQNLWSQPVFPTAAWLDQVVDTRPVYLERIDGHAAWVNATALQLAGIHRGTQDPPGGAFLRAPDSAPTGILIDTAMTFVQRLLPSPSDEELQSDLSRGLQACAQVGLTGVHEMGTTPAMFAALARLDERGELPLRVACYLLGEDAELEPLLLRGVQPSARLRIAGVKLYADGALGSRGAALEEPYADAPTQQGLWVTDPVTLRRRAQRLAGWGYPVAIHAIGDRAVTAALDAIAQASRPGLRHRVEHVQILNPHDLPRFVSLGVAASVQPQHWADDLPWVATRLGVTRMARAYPWRSLLAAGVRLACGSDAPVAAVSPWYGLCAALTRGRGRAFVAGGTGTGEQLSLTEALRGYTQGAAAACPGAATGMIAIGAPADFTVVQQDPYQTAPEWVPQTRVLASIVGGQASYVDAQAGGLSTSLPSSATNRPSA